MDSREQLQSLIETLRAFESLLPAIEAAGEVIAGALKNGNKFLTCGNGGSASDALHLSEELVDRFDQDRPSLASICLSADPTCSTCIGNDYGYEGLFAREIVGLDRRGDVLVIFSSIFNSENPVKALLAAKPKEILTISV